MRSTSKLVLSAAVATTVATLFPVSTRAVDFVWNVPAGGSQSWQVDGNWNQTGFPNANTDTADLRVALTNNLTLDVGATNVTTASLALGGTVGGVTTNVISTGGQIILDDPVDTNPAQNSLLISQGVAGSINRVSAPISLRDTVLVDAASTRSLTLGTTGATALVPFGADRMFTNNLDRTLGLTLTINGDIVLSDTNDADAVTANAGRRMTLGASGAGNGTTIINGKFQNGPLPVASVSGGSGPVNMGNSGSVPSASTIAQLAPPRFELNADNSTSYNGITILNRGSYVINHASAFGSNEVRLGNPNSSFGFNFTPSLSAPVLATRIRTAQWLTVRDAAQDYELSGILYSSSARGVVNLLPDPANNQLTLSGRLYAANDATARIWMFEGSGTTLVTNGISNRFNTAADPDLNDGTVDGILGKRGTGTTIITGTQSTYRGVTFVNGGLLEFGSQQSYGVQTSPANVGTSGISAASGGAVGVRTGSTAPAFLNLIISGSALYNSTGGLALAGGTSDETAAIDFTTGTLSDPKAVGMSIGALSGGATFTGSITPAANNYRLGGGGRLTMANANQLSGARTLEVVNGGTVVLNQTQNFSGATTVQGNYISTLQQLAEANTAGLVQAGARTAPGTYVSPVLEVKHLDDTSGSSLGTASSAASNLNLRGGTLRYSGTTNDQTNRLFTIGATGATLDSSGTGTVRFSNTGSIVSEDTGTLLATASTTGSPNPPTQTITLGDNNASSTTANLAVGMTVLNPNIPAGATITSLTSDNTGSSNTRTIVITLSSAPTAHFTAGDLSFGNQNRTLTLTGSNAGDNTIAGVLGNSPTGTLGVTKTGSGKWVLSGANTYTGATNVNGGTLVMTKGLKSAAALTIATGARAFVPPVTPNTYTPPSIVPSGNNANGSKVSSLNIANDGAPLGSRTYTGQLDLGNSDLVVDYTGASPLEDIKDMLRSGYNFGGWDGQGINTDTLNANNAEPLDASTFGIGYAENDGSLPIFYGDGTPDPLFFGQAVDDTTVMVKFTWVGDLNLDGFVDFQDLSVFNTNYDNGASSGRYWFEGDFNYDGAIDFQDLSLFNTNYDPTKPSLPEPTSLATLGAVGLLAMRRRHRHRG